MATRVERPVLTYEHYLELPDDGRRYEIIEGELYVSPSPSEKHQRTTTELTIVVGAHVYEAGLGRVYTAPFDVMFTRISIVQPDMLFVSADRLDVITAANVQGAPDLVVEVISPSSTRTDQETKRALYEKYGVQNFWVFEPIQQWVRAYALGADGTYELVAEAHGATTFSAPPFPDLAIDVARLWGA